MATPPPAQENSGSSYNSSNVGLDISEERPRSPAERKYRYIAPSHAAEIIRHPSLTPCGVTDLPNGGIEEVALQSENLDDCPYRVRVNFPSLQLRTAEPHK